VVGPWAPHWVDKQYERYLFAGCSSASRRLVPAAILHDRHGSYVPYFVRCQERRSLSSDSPRPLPMVPRCQNGGLPTALVFAACSHWRNHCSTDTQLDHSLLLLALGVWRTRLYRPPLGCCMVLYGTRRHAPRPGYPPQRGQIRFLPTFALLPSDGRVGPRTCLGLWALSWSCQRAGERRRS
jgi:hypothetical protein